MPTSRAPPSGAKMVVQDVDCLSIHTQTTGHHNGPGQLSVVWRRDRMVVEASLLDNAILPLYGNNGVCIYTNMPVE